MTAPVILLAVAGVVFRFDDVHDAAKWRQVAEAFESEGARASFAVPIGWVREASKEEFLREAAKRGHDIMDHTYDHTMFSCRCRDKDDFSAVRGRSFVSAADLERQIVEFRFACETNHPLNRPFSGAVSNGVLIVSEETAAQLHRPSKVYIPALDRYFGFYPSKDGHLPLYSFYRQERVAVPDLSECEMLLCHPYAFSLSDDVLRFQAERSRKAFRRIGLPDPKVWIQPGGWDPWLPLEAFLRVYVREYGYVAADCIGGLDRRTDRTPAADPNTDSYTLRPCNFFDNSSVTPESIRRQILSPRHEGRPLCFLSHMSVPVSMRGGWNEWLAETRSLLRWLRHEGIPVCTFSGVAEKISPNFLGVAVQYGM